MSTQALVVSDHQEVRINQTLSLIRPVAQIQELIGFHTDMRRVIKDVLIEDQDYGKVPGTDKNTLYKSGAEKVCIAFGASPKYERIVSEVDHDKEVKWQKKKKKWNNAYKGDRTFTIETEEGSSFGLYRYLYKCRIVRSDGRELGEGEGVCSTLESKFIDRPRDCENNVCKMAQKRAFVAGVLNAFGLSDSFTQDVEDDHYTEPRKSPPQSNSLPDAPQIQQQQPIYDPANETMEKNLFKFLTDKNISPDYFPEISLSMKGRPYRLSEFEAFLKENNL